MRLKVKITFNDEERQAVLEFARTTQLSVGEFCRKAVVYAMNDSYRRAAAAEASARPVVQPDPMIIDVTPEEVLDAEGNVARDPAPASVDGQGSSDSAPLADTQAVVHPQG